MASPHALAEWIPQLSLLEFFPSHGANEAGAAEAWIQGASQVAGRLRARATEIGRSPFALVYVSGEAGAGKERVARWIHRCSTRNRRPLAEVDVSLPSGPLQLQRLRAAIEQGEGAAPGNIIVRGIEDITPDATQRLHEVLSAAKATLQPRCGVILVARMTADALRARSLQLSQLLGRTPTALLEVPALRARAQDLAEISRTMVEEAARRYGKDVRGFSPQAIARLQHHPLPGNLRQLQAIVEQAVLETTGQWIAATQLGFPEPATPTVADAPAQLVIRLPGSSLREIELAALKLALKISDGRVVRASELLGITRHALRRKLEKFGLQDLRHTTSDDDDAAESEPDAATI